MFILYQINLLPAYFVAAVRGTIAPCSVFLISFMTILLSTLNARYAHASLGLRYLFANMGEMQGETQLQEFVIGAKTTDIVEKLLSLRKHGEPLIIGFGVYIWNVEELTRIVVMLKQIAPEVIVVLGGPEVSYESEQQLIVRTADYVITGWGDVTFASLCRQLLHGPKPLMKMHAGAQPKLDQIALPYAYFSDTDIAHRILYVEASRGCPFKCEFCLSALDKTAWPFDLDLFLSELETLYQRGARLFKFVDRTFNLNIKSSLKIMQFFLDKLEARPDDPVFAHFEVVPDHLPDALKASILKFPAGSLQFEIGIQTFNPAVQTLVSRKQDNEKAAENIRWLCQHSQAHLHVDLIAGLPGEDLASFARGFNQLVSLQPHEIQFGILKRLRGTPIIRHTEPYGMVFDSQPPYTILATKDVDFGTMQRLVRFARYWDLVANSGRFRHTLPLILGDDPFGQFMALSDWLYGTTDATHRIAMERLAKLVADWLVQERNMEKDQIAACLKQDYAGQTSPEKVSRSERKQLQAEADAKNAAPQRQARHMQ